MAGPALVAPTQIRHAVLGLLCALAFILYLDRICIGQAASSIQDELGLSNTQMGVVFGAFTVAYGLFEVITGHWGDRYGSRKVLLRIVLWWSGFTALTGCVWRFSLDSGRTLPGLGVPLVFDSFMLLLLIRFLFGVGEAGALPNMARVLSSWYPPGGRGPAQGLINTAALVGGAVAPVACAYIIQLLSWRTAFFFFGSLGVVWAVAFWAWFQDDPAQHAGVNNAELSLIRAGAPPGAAGAQHPSIPWRLVLSSSSVWLLGLIMSCMSSVTYVFFSWYPKYLQSARGVPELRSGQLASLVLAGGAIGSTLGGFLADYLARRMGGRRWSVPLQGGCGALLSAAAVLGSIHCDWTPGSAILVGVAYVAVGIQVGAWWAAVTEISGPHLGALFGLMNSIGGVGAVFSQVFLGWFADYRAGLGYTGRQQWDPAFYLYVVLLLVGGVAWLLIHAGRSVVAEPSEPAGLSRQEPPQHIGRDD